ncbi:MAG: NRDE family protein [Gammaproteobacteria bacterium]|nr:NRDE family protein [Gammaproteobacteria bacterium]
MCVLVAAIDDHADYDLVVMANRDEFHARPSAAAAPWDDAPTILAGRDLSAGGTWLGVDRAGHFAAVTNVRSNESRPAGRSRGFLVSDFLRPTGASSAAYTAALTRAAPLYAGVNLIAADRHSAHIWSNLAGEVTPLARGLHGLSNGAFGEEWPKVTQLKLAYARARSCTGEDLITALLNALRDTTQPADALLPQTGVGLAREGWGAAVFIVGEGYGTRCSSVVLRGRTGQLQFIERRYAIDTQISGESRYTLAIGRP